MATCFILNGHPLAPSFSAALAERYAHGMRRNGVDVCQLDLADLHIPALQTRHPGDAEMGGDVLLFWEHMVRADHIAIIHPLWWGGMPAQLKALFDIGLQADKAYRYEANNPLPLGLLKGRSARLITTSDTPGWFMALVYSNAHFRTVKNQMLKFVGMSPVWTTHLSVMRDAKPEMLEKMLDRAAKDGAADARKLLTRAARSNPFSPRSKPNK